MKGTAEKLAEKANALIGKQMRHRVLNEVGHIVRYDMSPSVSWRPGACSNGAWFRLESGDEVYVKMFTDKEEQE